MLKLHTQTIGHGQDIILLHGLGLHSKIWDPLIPFLAKNYRVTTVDLPGFGASKHIPSTQDLRCLANSVLAVCPNKAIFIGWSLGALVALAIANFFPIRAEKIISIASNPCFIAQPNWPGLTNCEFDLLYTQAKNDFKNTFVKFLFHQLTKKYALKHLSPLKEFYHQDLQSHFLENLLLLKKTDFRSSINKISCKQLYLFGELDPIVPLAVKDHLQQNNKSIQSAVINIATHIPFLTHTTETTTIIQRFLNDH